ncbi:unnamed protein product [Danaus chrysippus]|uniref:(African queen) hypothetical protein n=1 Tax=Danaus chrysippus TaxID=151541 RepID=A0A8J2R5X3_9NEOP|nr:unnamed protein product [Danaus chrysippus]
MTTLRPRATRLSYETELRHVAPRYGTGFRDGDYYTFNLVSISSSSSWPVPRTGPQFPVLCSRSSVSSSRSPGPSVQSFPHAQLSVFPRPPSPLPVNA